MLTATMASPASASASMASPDSFRQVQGALQIGLGQDRGELLAAIASDDVSRAVDASRGEPSDDPQHLVALGMAIMVVERLDPVRVDHDQVPFAGGACPPGHGTAHAGAATRSTRPAGNRAACSAR